MAHQNQDFSSYQNFIQDLNSILVNFNINKLSYSQDDKKTKRKRPYKTAAFFFKTKLYFKKGKVKVEIAVAKGKKQYDKRQAKKQRDWNREKSRYFRKTS